jgi:hypothetical protein
MNRSIFNVVLGGVGTSDKSLSKKQQTNDIATKQEYKEIDAVTVAQELKQSKIVTIVPGNKHIFILPFIINIYIIDRLWVSSIKGTIYNWRNS